VSTLHHEPFAAASVPGPPPLPLLGGTSRMIAFAMDPVGTATRLFARYGDLVAIVRAPAKMMTPGGRAVLVARGAEINRTVLTSPEVFHSYALPGIYFPEDPAMRRAATFRARLTGRARPERLAPIRRTFTGLFHVNEEEHRRHKRLLLPAFQKQRIDAYRDDMVALTHAALATWREGETRDVHADMTQLTLEIATKTLFGEGIGERGLVIARRMQEWLVTMFQPSMIVRADLPFCTYRRWLDLTEEIDAQMREIVRAKRTRAVGRDMLSMLIAARDEDGSRLSEDDLIGHTGVIFGAGHETSTNALAWTLFLLSQHPTIARELDHELAMKLAGRDPTVAELAELPYLDGVVKESLRLLPPVPLHPRFVARETTLDGHVLAPGTELFLSILHMHHDAEVFPEAKVFSPDRWSRIKPTVYEYNPFSAGPRMCIGAAFALLEIKIVLAILLQCFRVELEPGARIDRRVAITMAPKHGMPMRLLRADGAWRRDTSPRGDIHELVQLDA
jgi:cytochrome P450